MLITALIMLVIILLVLIVLLMQLAELVGEVKCIRQLHFAIEGLLRLLTDHVRSR